MYKALSVGGQTVRKETMKNNNTGNTNNLDILGWIYASSLAEELDVFKENKEEKKCYAEFMQTMKEANIPQDVQMRLEEIEGMQAHLRAKQAFKSGFAAAMKVFAECQS